MTHTGAGEGALAQGYELQPGSKAQVVLLDPGASPFEGRETETWDDRFAIDVGGESTPRSVDFADVESLHRSLRLGNKAGRGALMGGAIVGATGFLFGYCFQVFSDECAEDFELGIQVGLVGAAAGALVGAGIGLMISRYGPWESVGGLEGPNHSGDLDMLSVHFLPYPDGRVDLEVTLHLGGPTGLPRHVR